VRHRDLQYRGILPYKAKVTSLVVCFKLSCEGIEMYAGECYLVKDGNMQSSIGIVLIGG
jgi:hypothetical protein